MRRVLAAGVLLFAAASADKLQRSQDQFEKGLRFIESNDYEQALAAFEQAATLNPRSSDAIFNLANTLRELSRLDDAKREYKRCVRVDPQHADCFFNLGITYRRTDELELSIQAFKDVLRISPRYRHRFLLAPVPASGPLTATRASLAALPCAEMRERTMSWASNCRSSV